MKKAGSLLALLLAALMLISCGASSSSQESDSQPDDSVSVEVSSVSSAVPSAEIDPRESGLEGAPVLPEVEPEQGAAEQPWAENAENVQIPDFLDEEQTLLYQKAAWAYPQMGIITSGFGTTGNGETVDIDGLIYYKADGIFTRWDEFYSAMTEIFTAEYFTVVNEAAPGISFYIEVDGDLYCLLGDRGGDYRYVPPDTFEVLEQTDSKLVFNRIGHYLPEEMLEAGGDLPETWEGINGVEEAAFQIQFVKTDAGWRVAEFNIPY